jgi:protein-S-isoprenylcysteine O-methyltransferase Ste14
MPTNSGAIPAFSAADTTVAKPDETMLSPSSTSFEITVLDVVERVIFAGIFARFAAVTVQNFVAMPSIETCLMLVSEVLPCTLILCRKPSNAMSTRPSDWFFGLAGSIAPLLIKPAAVAPLLPAAICLLVIIGGLFMQISAKVVLGRSFGMVAANRGVKMAGPYRTIRHPMYAGYTIGHIGLLLAMPSLLNAALYALAFAFQVVRILREEAVLMQSQDYRNFAARVRYRLLPGIF